MFPALFLALLVGQLDGPRARAAALAGGLIALALTPLVPPGRADRRGRGRRRDRARGAAMIGAWIAVAAVGIATIAIKGAGPVVFAGRPLPRTLALVMPLLAPCLLAALVVGQTLGDGRALVVDARLAGVAAAAVALLLRAPLLVVLAAAAGVAAGARALGAA